MLELENVGLTLSGREILKNVSLAVPRGGITVLLGKNGSGKSSLFRAVGRELPCSGTIRLDGTDIALLPPRERARRIAILPQILPTVAFTVEGLVALGRTPHLGLLSHPSAEDTIAVADAIAAVGLAHRKEDRLTALSGGERQRAFLAMTLSQGAELLLLDEPTTYLDTASRRELLTLIKALTEDQGKSAFLILHDPNDAIRIADRLFLLDAGRLVFRGSPAEFIEEALPERHFGLTRHEVKEEAFPFYY